MALEVHYIQLEEVGDGGFRPVSEPALLDDTYSDREEGIDAWGDLMVFDQDYEVEPIHGQTFPRPGALFAVSADLDDPGKLYYVWTEEPA